MSKARVLCVVALLAILFVWPRAASGQGQRQQPTAGGEVVDYTVATVNRKLITYSDLVWQLALEPDTPLARPSAEQLSRTLERLIDQRLLYDEAEKMPHLHAEDPEVEAGLAELVRRFPSPAEFRERVTSVGLTTERVREIVAERIEINKYLDFRFRSFTVVTPKEVEDYYRDAWVPRFRARSPGLIVPRFDEVRAEIESTLTEAKIESDLSKYLEEARDRAEIVILTRF